MSADAVDRADTAARAPATGRRRHRGTRPWILMYHSVADPRDDPYGIVVAPDRLDRQLRALTRMGLTGVGVGTLLRARAQRRDRGLVGLTFDDGYTDFTEAALPVLRRYGCTATLFVLPGRLGGRNDWDPEGPRRPLVDQRGIAAAVAAGTEIGSHGLYHVDLTAVADGLLHEETRRSRGWLRELTGTEPEGFCYPYGTVDRRVRAAVRDAGYAYACAIRPAPLVAADVPVGEPYALPRTHVSQADGALRLRVKRLRHRLGV
ncbi:polysaccharide deacetylase family protein [Streptomyces yaizuensis]|uniref:Polysaccharide deacetylase family protein n=1 Tax=Streptomyces yaizuensis TaxID=2989713 RepID=A0ABQ5NVF1_9ACTN|nr:polysaccharide deacetylase family protein [Streptomyces sp. YSPA8]GLF94348.1 polysaccharide deacetylase family protein [Streptomyces sp. YSPA8]